MNSTSTATNTPGIIGILKEQAAMLIPNFGSNSGNTGKRTVKQVETIPSAINSNETNQTKKKSLRQRLIHPFKVTKNQFTRTADIVHNIVGGIIGSPITIIGVFSGFTVGIICAPIVSIFFQDISFSTSGKKLSTFKIMVTTVNEAIKPGANIGHFSGAIVGGVVGKTAGIVLGIPAAVLAWVLVLMTQFTMI